MAGGRRGYCRGTASPETHTAGGEQDAGLDVKSTPPHLLAGVDGKMLVRVHGHQHRTDVSLR